MTSATSPKFARRTKVRQRAGFLPHIVEVIAAHEQVRHRMVAGITGNGDVSAFIRREKGGANPIDCGADGMRPNAQFTPSP